MAKLSVMVWPLRAVVRSGADSTMATVDAGGEERGGGGGGEDGGTTAEAKALKSSSV